MSEGYCMRCKVKREIKEAKEGVGRKVLAKMDAAEKASNAGRTLVEYRKHKTRKLTTATNQSTFAFG